MTDKRTSFPESNWPKCHGCRKRFNPSSGIWCDDAGRNWCRDCNPDEPQPGRQYRLTGDSKTPSVMRGDNLADCEV